MAAKIEDIRDLQGSRAGGTGWTVRRYWRDARRGRFAGESNLRLELSETLGHYVQRARRPLWARCASMPCRHSKRLEPLRLANRYGWTATLESIRRRLRCIRCGCRDCELVDFDPKSPPPPYPDFKTEATPADLPSPRRARRHR